ncbi:sodium/hydrogen exchanger 10-like isoform X4 [Ostrea edulis]|uniref:sodium/hydrogen exchanger 10-like isoform X4 n=1 Tax=Ostrea edulis TaxID=37623 RepID=UPI0024AF9FD5|nr:sodium/hydrogen exchanger 10-like isoform X4 [Ostrea edulis]
MLNISNISSAANISLMNSTRALAHHNKKYEADHKSLTIIFFIFFSCALGALVRQIIHCLKIRLPYTVVLLVLGVLFGLLSSNNATIHAYAGVVETDPHLLLFIFLPVLIFESAFGMEVHTFMKTFIQVLLLAIPGLAMASLFTCLLARYLFTYEWDWNIGMMFGSILSATDPVAVVALLRDLGASKQLAMVVEGESLVNDGTAIVFYNVFVQLATSEKGLTGGEIVVKFLQVALGGPLWGFFTAKITLFCLSRVFNDALVEITITLASTYLTFYVGEVYLGVSGVLATVVLGVTMNAGKTMISPEVEHFLHRFWETLAYIANTLIFIIVGMVIAEKAIFEIHGIDWFYMFALYFGIFVIRGLVIAIFSPILRHTGYGLSWQEGMVMTWGGLRGAVGLALALQVAHHEEIDSETVGIRVLIHVSGVVFLTLLINATTCSTLLKVLGMSDISPAKKMSMANSLRFLEDMREKALNMLKSDRFLADADWDTVEKSCEIDDPYKTTEEEAEVEDSLDIRPNAICPECDSKLPAQYTRKELRDMTNEAILRMLKAEKMSYWRQFEQGMLSREAVRKLHDCTDIAADKQGKFIDVDEIKKSWEVPKFYVNIKRFVMKLIDGIDIPEPKSVILRYLYRVTQHHAFYFTMVSIIIIDMVNVALSIVCQYHPDWKDKQNIFRSLNVLFVALYIVECVVKVLVQRKEYIRNGWNSLCVAIISLGVLDIIVGFTLPAVFRGDHKSVTITVVIFMLFRIIRLFRLLEPLMPLVVKLLKRQISKQLSYGYDVGRGYVAGEEEVRKLIDHMVDQKDIAKNLKQSSDNGRLDVIRCLGMLQKQHPDIALSIKTRQAIRSVLNNLRDGVHELLMDGILEEAEGTKLEKMVEEKMKRLLNFPPNLPLPPPEFMLKHVFWLRNDTKLISYIKSQAKLISYNYDDVIIHEGDPPGGIYILVSGMVRINKAHQLESTIQPGKPIIYEGKPTSGSELQIKANLIDFLTSGNIIGEMGLLTKRPRSATVTCETSVQVLFISGEDMEKAMLEFHDSEPSLEYRLWHVCANRIATSILMKQPAYQGWTKEKIKLQLENSYLLDSDDIDIFTVDATMSDVVLINGHAQNVFTREAFSAPCYIPWTVLKLELQPEKGPKTVLLIVPTEMGQPTHSQHVSGHDTKHGHGAFVRSISQLCLKHASNHRSKVMSKWKINEQLQKIRTVKKIQQAKSLGILTNKNVDLSSDHKTHVKLFNEENEEPNRMLWLDRERTLFAGVRASTPGLLEGRPLRSLSMDYQPSHSDADLEPRTVVRRSISADPAQSSSGSSQSENNSSSFHSTTSNASVYSPNVVDPNFILHTKIIEENEEIVSPDESPSPTLKNDRKKKEHAHFGPTHYVGERKEFLSDTSSSSESPVCDRADSVIDTNINSVNENVGNHIPESTPNIETYSSMADNTPDQSKLDGLTDGMYVCSLTVGNGHPKLSRVDREETKF